jgi:tRNA modification GTPase
VGARIARPGEFTERAFLNGKLDLAQAEAVADLIDASTEQAARAAVRSLEGEFSRTVGGLAATLLELRLLVEATLDFPEEEIDFLEAAQARERLAACGTALEDVRRAARRGALLRDGITVVLAGEPNVGKSSLLNALAGAELAIVTPIAGTTRDRIAQAIQIEGVPINVVDTAGLRDTDDEVERIGIARTWQAVEGADLVVHLLDARAVESAAARALEQRIRRRVGRSVPVLRVLNKIDLLASGGAALLPQAPQGSPACAVVPALSGEAGAVGEPVDELLISARTGAGIDALRRRLLQWAGGEPGAETVFTARARHVEALAQSAGHLDAAVGLLARGGQALDLLAEELRLAHDALAEITGRVSPDQLLGEIFSRFCIGK